MPAGRPTIYNQALADLICERVATHDMGLTRLCKKYDDLPDKDTVNVWRHRYPEFSANYALAKIKQSELLAEDILDIADDSTGDIMVDEDGNERYNSEFVARSRLRIDSRKWLASKLAPKIYGDLAKQAEEKKDSLIEQLINKLPS